MSCEQASIFLITRPVGHILFAVVWHHGRHRSVGVSIGRSNESGNSGSCDRSVGLESCVGGIVIIPSFRSVFGSWRRLKLCETRWPRQSLWMS